MLVHEIINLAFAEIGLAQAKSDLDYSKVDVYSIYVSGFSASHFESIK